MASVTLDNVKKVYAGGVEAVKGVSLAVPDGSFTVLLGPSGCGKSTLLRMIAGLETISAGTISIGGKVVNEVEPADRDIAMVFQNYALYPHMRVYDNMAYGLRNRGTPKDEIERRVQEAARLLAIGDFLKRRPRALSGGQRQRVAMGRAIVREPQAFLFDEPLSNLDAKLRVQMRHRDPPPAQPPEGDLDLRHARSGRGDDAGRPGRGHEQGHDRAGRPADRGLSAAGDTFVATFIGSPAMNLVEGSVDGSGPRRDRRRRQPRVRAAGRSLPRRDRKSRSASGRRMLSPANGNDRLSLAFAPEFVEELGPNRLVHGTAGGAPLVVSVACVGRRRCAAADPLLIAAASNVHLFDIESGRSLRCAS